MLKGKVTPSRLLFRAIAHATEDLNKVIKAVKNVVGEDIEINISRTKGYFGNDIIIISGEVKRGKTVESILRKILEDENNKKYILDTIEERIDERYHLYIRINKQEAYKGNIIVSEGDDVIHLTFSFNVYPKKKEVLLNWIRSL